MVFQIGGNLRLLSVELEKLYVFANKKNITKSMVNEICTNKQDLFLFMDYVVNGQTIKAIEEYNKLLMVSHPLAILSTLQKTLHSKILIKNYASKMSNDDIAKIIGMHPYRVKIEMGNLKNVSLKRLVQLKRNLTNAEFKIKTGQSIEMEKEIEYAILQ